MKCANITVGADGSETACTKEIGGGSGRMALSLEVTDGDDEVGSTVTARCIYCQEHGQALLLGFMKAMGIQAAARKEGV
jgi:hypothetical protein